MNAKTLQRQSWKTARERGVPLEGHPGWVDVSEYALSQPGRPDNLYGMYCTSELSVQMFHAIYHNAVDKYGHPDTDSMFVLGIRRHDELPIKFWDTLQEVKDVLAGKEETAVEIYPPADELVNDANMRWLWVIPKGEFLGFGWHRDGTFQ